MTNIGVRYAYCLWRPLLLRQPAVCWHGKHGKWLCNQETQWVPHGLTKFNLHRQAKVGNKYNLLMHRIKIKSRNFFMEWTKRFCGWIYLFSISSYSGGITMTKKPTGYWRHYHWRCRPPRSNGAWRPQNEQWAYTSNFVQYISGS